MAKKTVCKRKKREKSQQIDNIPKYFQQPRSPAPKRRTDFSLFFRSSSSSSPSTSLSNSLLHQAGSLLESFSGKEILSSVTVGTLDDRKSKTKDRVKNPPVRCSKSQDNGQEFFPTFFKVPVIEIESDARTASQRKEHPSSCRKLFSNQQDQSSGSSRTQTDFLRTRRGNRTRKPKVHFDEVTFPLKSVTKVRRLRIMRYLGLAAPIGSPFSLTNTGFEKYLTR